LSFASAGIVQALRNAAREVGHVFPHVELKRRRLDSQDDKIEREKKCSKKEKRRKSGHCIAINADRV